MLIPKITDKMRWDRRLKLKNGRKIKEIEEIVYSEEGRREKKIPGIKQRRFDTMIFNEMLLLTPILYILSFGQNDSV